MQIRYAVCITGLSCLAAAGLDESRSVETSNGIHRPSPARASNLSITVPASNSKITVPTDIASYLSCYSEVTAWRNASSSWWITRESHPTHSTVVKCTPHAIQTTLTTPSPVTTGTKYITLCDGIPRQVGQVTTVTYPPYEITSTQQETCISYFEGPTFAAPSPTCRGNCVALSKYFEARGSSMDYGVCTNAMGYGYNCGACMLTGKSARLLYWPQSTVPGSGDLCTEGRAIDATPTGDGPNVVVTNGLTLTSPTVALALTGLGRQDGCFSTIAETILPFHPEAISSVRGFRAWYSDWAFNFTDLNIQCLNDTAGQDDCFTAVPVTPYFYGLSRDATLDLGEITTTADRTIYNNYRPVIVPPTALTDIFASVFGPGCALQVDGIWDPPTALQLQTALPVPTVPAAAMLASTSTSTGTNILTVVNAAPTPAGSSLHVVSATATAVPDEGAPSPLTTLTLSSSSSASASTVKITAAVSLASIGGHDNNGQGIAVEPDPDSLTRKPHGPDVGDTISAQSGIVQTLSASDWGSSQMLLTTVAPGIGTSQTHSTSAGAPVGQDAIATSQSADESGTITSVAVRITLQMSSSLIVAVYGGVILTMCIMNA